MTLIKTQPLTKLIYTKMKNQIKLNNINLIKALLNEGNEKEFNQSPEKLWAVSYEFYKFYSVYKDELYTNFDKHIEATIDKVNDPLCEFPLFCITAFANAYDNYKLKEDETY